MFSLLRTYWINDQCRSKPDQICGIDTNADQYSCIWSLLSHILDHQQKFDPALIGIDRHWSLIEHFLTILTGIYFREAGEETPYVFFMESATADYHLQRQPCNLARIPYILNTKGYGLAFPLIGPGSDLYHRFNLALVELLEVGELARLERKWWYDKGECSIWGTFNYDQGGEGSAK